MTTDNGLRTDGVFSLTDVTDFTDLESLGRLTTDYRLRTTDYGQQTGSGLLSGLVFEFFSFELDGVSEVFGVAEELFGVGGEEVLLDVGRDGFSISADAPCVLFEYAEESVFFIFSTFFKVVET